MKLNSTLTPSAVKAAVEEMIILQREIDAVKPKYKRLDELTNLIAPVFIRKTPSGWIFKQAMKWRNRAIRIVLACWNEKKAEVNSTTWKSSAQRSFTFVID